MSDDYQVPDYMTKMLAAVARMEIEMAQQTALLTRIAQFHGILSYPHETDKPRAM